MDTNKATYKRQLAGNLDYIASAPRQCVKAAVDAKCEELEQRQGTWRGQDGACLFTNPRGVQAAGSALDRGGWNDPGQRFKIFKYARADGTAVPIGVIRAAASRGNVFPPSEQVVVFQGYNNDKRVTIQQAVLAAYQPALFDRLRRWAHGEMDADVTYMIGHRCQNGNLGCITSAHLFLVTGSANQSQRNCVAAKLEPCNICGHFPQLTECYCTKNIVNKAMPDNKVPLCVTCLPAPSAMASAVTPQVHQAIVQERDALARERDTVLAAYNDQVEANQVLRTRMEDYVRQYRELCERFREMGGIP